MDTAPKPRGSSANRARLAVSWLLFVVFVALLGFGIVLFQTQNVAHDSGLAMAVVGLLGLAALATLLKLARARAVANRGGVYVGRSYGGTGAAYAGGINHHDQWFHQHQMWEQRRRDDEYQQQQQQQQNYYVQQQQQQQQQQWNDYR